VLVVEIQLHDRAKYIGQGGVRKDPKDPIVVEFVLKYAVKER
jgi:hypothetical protein